jgi:hypothetical protein
MAKIKSRREIVVKEVEEMGIDYQEDLINVRLPRQLVHGLLAFKRLTNRQAIREFLKGIDVDDAREICAEAKPNFAENSRIEKKRFASQSYSPQLKAQILGETVRGQTLPELFARCVDTISELDTTAIERLAKMKTHARRYVAREPTDIHFKSDNLNSLVRKTESGWWISTNVSQKQVVSAIRALAVAADLTFGKDIIFPWVEGARDY